MSYFLGIDLGASSLKASVIDAEASLVASVTQGLVSRAPAALQVEQNPADWRAALFQALARLRQEQADVFAQISAISFSGGAHIGVLQDAHSEVLRPAIMWSDQRASKQAQTLQSENIEASTGNRPNPTWTLAQLLWLQEHEPETMQRVARISFAKDWLRSQLTGDWQTDASEAVGAMLADYRAATQAQQWDAGLLERVGLSVAHMPPIVDMRASAGTLTPEAAQATGLPASVSVYQGAIDTSVEWLCCGALDDTTASLKLASAGVLAFTTADDTPHPPVSLYPHILPAHHYHAAGMNNCASALQWVRQLYLGDMSPSDMDQLAASAPLGSDGVVFYPYLNGERAPLWDASLTASLQGLTRATDQACIARAAYEGVGHALREIFDDMAHRLATRPDCLHVLGGGAQSPFWAQMLADMLGVTIKCGQQTDCSFATALLALSAHRGDADMVKIAGAAYRPERIFTPDKSTFSDYALAHLGFLAGRIGVGEKSI
jgi:xylulokinase